jgi:RNA polymerase sigma factor (sigma-70 family)
MRAMWSDGWESVVNQRAYLYRTVTLQSRMHHRSSMRRKAREARTAEPGFVAAGDAEVDVWEALAHLSVPQRAVVFLIYWEDLTEADCATRLGISDRTVRRHLARARQQLERMLR